MYAVVEAGGRQYQLTSGRYVDVELVQAEPEQEFVFEKVLAIVNGKESVIGAPFVDGARVIGKIISHGRGEKLIVYKYRPKKGTRKRTGHRQGFTRIWISAIKHNDKVVSEVADKGKAAPREEKAAAPSAKKTAAPDKAAAKPEAAKKDAAKAPKAEAADAKEKSTKAPAKKKTEE